MLFSILSFDVDRIRVKGSSLADSLDEPIKEAGGEEDISNQDNVTKQVENN